MSFHINSDKEKIRGVNPKIIGDNEATIRVGTGVNEVEIMRLQKDPVSGLPRVGINRSGQKVNNIDLDNQGSGYNQAPLVEIDPPPAGGTQAQASASIFNGRVTSIVVNDPGSGYTSAPNVVLTGGNGSGASATAFLDTVEFELDINGAIRTSTSIISDTARILNIDVENFVTPDLNLRAPNLKTFMNGTGTPWAANVIVQKGQYRYSVSNVYQALNTGTTGVLAPEHKDGVETNGEVQFKHIGFRVNNATDFSYLQTGEAGTFPRSITPILGDRSDKIATTEYVLNLATNDVGGRVYVSQQIGSDLNDGRSAVNPVRTIKKAAQIAWSTPGVKETLIISGGDYVEDNPISLPPDCSVVGDNLRLVIIRPGNVGKHIFKFGDKNYVTGVTYRDKVDSNGDPTGTWDFAMVFDDKQRIIIDNEVNGDFGVEFPIGHQVFGPDRFRISFQNNTGLSLLASGVQILGLNTGARANVFDVNFSSTTGANAFVAGTIDVQLTSGSFIEGDQYSYISSAATGGALTQTISGTAGENTLRFTTDPTSDLPVGNVVFLDDTDNSSFTQGYYQVSVINNGNAPTYWDVTFNPILGAQGWNSTLTETITINSASPTTNTIDTVNLKSIRAEGEVVSYDEDVTSTLPITRLDFSLQGDPSIATGGFQEQQFGSAEDLGGIVVYTSALVGRTNTHEFKEGQEIILENLPTSGPDLSFLNGKQRIYKVLEDADGRARRFVIPKKVPSLTTANFQPSEFAVVKSYSKSVTLSLLNSPNKFPLATPVERRYQDACQLIRNNRDYIAEEVIGIINDQFKTDYYSVYNIDTVNNTFDIYLGPLDHENTYVSGGTVTFGGTSYAISGFVYDTAVTGVATITTTAAAVAALSEDDTVQLADILISCSAGQKIYPAYSSPTSGNNTGTDGDTQCKQDIIHFLNALVRDLEFGSNHNVIEAAKKYIVGGKIAFIEDEIIQNVRAIEYARELAIYAMCNWRIKNRTTADPLYVTKHATTPRYTDPTVINTTAGTPACDDVRSAIDTLSFLWVDIITNNQNGTYLDAAYLIARNADLIADQALIDTEIAYPTLNLSDVHQRKCRRDIKIVLEGLTRDLVLGGNHGVVSTAESYFSGTSLSGISEAQRPQTIYAFQRVKLYAIYAMRNWSDGNVLQTTPIGSTYVPTTGAMTVTIPDPAVIPVANSDRIAFAEGAITYSCAHDGGGNDASPYRTDTNFGQSFLITNVVSNGGNTTISLNVGAAGSNTDAHTFVSAIANGTKVIYGPVTLTSPIPKFEDWSILTDVNASAPIGIFTPSNATYDTATGDFVLTMNSHGLTTSNTIRLQPESFVFTCTMDGNKTEHALPGDGQSAYGNNLVITGTTTNTVTVNVGASGPNVQFTPSAATYNPSTGALVLEIGSHTLDVGEGVVIADNSLSFTCAMDGNQSTKTYPRPGIDPFAGRSMPITGKTATSITINAGISGPNKYFQPTGANYNPSTGDLVLTVGQHGLGVGRGVVIEDNSLTFTCDIDGNVSNETYPRSTDPASGASLEITAVGTTSHTVTDAPYDATTGIVTLTIAGHGFANGDYVKVADGSLTYTCDLDGNTVQKTYPRAGYDYPSGRWLEISNVTTNTFDINVGGSSYQGAHTFVSASANGLERQDGTFTVNVGGAGSASGSVHTFVSAQPNAVKHEPQSAHTFVSASTNAVSHSPQSAHTFVRTNTDSVSAYSSTAGSICSGVESTINTALELFEDILDGTTVAGSTTQTFGTLYETNDIITYPDSFINDFGNNRMAVRGRYDDFPIIEASPYTQNASVISFRGGGGALIDGTKVKQPNCPFPGLEPDGSASFPNQGKSMVAAAFTIVSFGGTGYKVIEDGYTQLVSVFVIFCQDGVLCETGGYASITNSATNFGTFALRGTGFRRDCYEFDVATVNVVSQTPTGRTTLAIGGIGREPLEHYICKFDGFRNADPDKEFFIDAVSGVTVGPPFTATLTLDDGVGNGLTLIRESDGATISGLTALQNALTPSNAANATLKLHRPSIVNSSSHTWEFAGSGTNYLALPENGGTKVEANEQVSENYGRVYVSGTDELGDFKVGTFARIENRTGAITFTGTVTISEVEFLKLKGGDVVVTGFDASNTLGGANSSDSKLPTQKAVRDYITNNLGPYINKPYSTNAVPRALVELTDSGKISIDQIPALRPFQVYTVADQAERTSIEGALAGDIAIQQDTSTSFILNQDNDSLFLGFQPDPNVTINTGDIYTGSLTTGRIQATEYRKGVVYQINITNGGSGYVTPPTISFSGGNPDPGAVSASATCTIANGTVVTVTIETFGGYKGGVGYTTTPTVTFTAPPGAGTQAQGSALIESRVYGNIVNNIKIEDTDTFQDSTTPTANTVNINRVVNTSSFDNNNWVSLSSNQIAASDITSGVIETDRLASGGAANSFTFLRGDQNFALAMQSIKGAETRYFAPLAAQCSIGSSQMIFTTNSDVLIGHEVKQTVNGVAANTNINGVVTSAGLTTVSLNNPVTQTIPLGTIIEFERGASPVTFESTFTQGGFIDDVIISNSGSGFTNGQYFDVELLGGTGTGLKVNMVVSGNAVTEITVTDGGTGYNADFTVVTAPGVIGSGSALVLEAKVSTVLRQYANVAIDVQRATDLTISADLYGTIGVSRFKKSQFNIGTAGNGSIELKTGADSGLDADLLDGAQGTFYTNATNLSSGTLSPDRLAGTYNISISNQSGSTLRLITGTNNPSSSPLPNFFSSGIVSNTIFNSANGLNDGGTRNMVVTFRQGGSGFDTGFGGVRQLAFTDNDNMYLRGSGTGVTSFGSWAKVWTSLNDGLDSGLDADRLDNRQGDWYQNALNINYGTLSDNRLPRFISATNFRDQVTVKGFLGDPKFRIYFSGVILDTSPTGVYTPGNPIKLYNANAQAVADFVIDSVTVNDDTSDNFNDFTILIGRLTSGNFTGAITAGTATNRLPFDDFTLEDGNTVDVAKLENDGGKGLIKVGRVDGQSSTPGLLFRSSQVVPANNVDDHYTVKLEASGGNATAGSGTLNASVANADSFTINGQRIWNTGNIQFSPSNISNYGVQRDSSGNFSAGTITASLTGAASLNVLKTGDTMTGTLAITGVGSNLTVSGNAAITGTTTLTNDLNVDSGVLFVDVSANEVGINVGTNPQAALHLKADSGLLIQTASNAPSTGARIRFSDHQSGNYTQQGTIRYNHSDSATPGSAYGEAFYVEGTETILAFKVTGDIIASRRIGINNDNPTFALDVTGNGRIRDGLTIDNASNNSGAPIHFLGSSNQRNFRVGNQLVANNLFTIQASTAGGGQSWNGTPAFSIRGDVNAVSINTTATSGTDPTNNTVRDYKLNIQGDVNFNGTLYQDNQEFVTSRWTEAPNTNDIYRASKVGIGFTSAKNPEEALEVEGNIEVSGTLEANGDAQWLDTYGVFKANRNTIDENVTIPQSTNCVTAGPVTINNNRTIVISDGASWSIV